MNKSAFKSKKDFHNQMDQMEKRRALASIIIVVIIGTLWISMSSTMYKSARATLASPRLGNHLRGPMTAGRYNTTQYLNETMTFWVAPESPEVGVPIAWRDSSKWSVALTPAVLPTADCTTLNIVDVITGKNPDALFGAGIDVNPISPTAVGLICQIPANIEPVIYNLAIGYNEHQLLEDGSVLMVV